VSWAKAQLNTNYIVYTDVEFALKLLTEFVTDSSVRVVGIGLHKNLLAHFESQLPKDINRRIGLAEVVNEKRSLAAGGTPAGYEPLGFEGTKFHSWLCHYTPDEAIKRFGIRPNELGLINELSDAQQVNEFLLQTGAEPAIWEPWLVIDYTPKQG
jgi:hypothetical protein